MVFFISFWLVRDAELFIIFEFLITIFLKEKDIKTRRGNGNTLSEYVQQWHENSLIPCGFNDPSLNLLFID